MRCVDRPIPVFASCPVASRGFTLIEVMIAALVAALLMAGMGALWTEIDRQLFAQTLRQKAILRAGGELRRLSALYRLQNFVGFNWGDGGTATGRWIYRGEPPGVSDGPLVLEVGSDASAVADDLARGQVLHVDYSPADDSDAGDVNVVWLDRDRGLTALLEWRLTDPVGGCDTGSCYSLELTLRYPYRFREGVGPYVDEMARLDTITLRTVVGRW